MNRLTIFSILLLLAVSCDSQSSTDPSSDNPVADMIYAATGAEKVKNGQRLAPTPIGPDISPYLAVSQTATIARYSTILPWFDDQGELNFSVSIFDQYSDYFFMQPPGEEIAPLDWRGRFALAGDTPNTSVTETGHQLGGGGERSPWRETIRGRASGQLI